MSKFGATIFVSLTLHLLSATVTMAEDKGYFNCFRSTMSDSEREAFGKWFRLPGVSVCCNLADGMQGFAEDRIDGLYVAPRNVTLRLAEQCRDHPDQPPPTAPADHSDWIKVDSTRILRRSNPVGVVVVWWLASWEGEIPDQVWSPRCVADLERS